MAGVDSVTLAVPYIGKALVQQVDQGMTGVDCVTLAVPHIGKALVQQVDQGMAGVDRVLIWLALVHLNYARRPRHGRGRPTYFCCTQCWLSTCTGRRPVMAEADRVTHAVPNVGKALVQLNPSIAEDTIVYSTWTQTNLKTILTLFCWYSLGDSLSSIR